METQCSQQSFAFQSLGARRVTAGFDGGTITSDAGGLLLREVESKTGLLADLADCFDDCRDLEPVERTVVDLLKQRVQYAPIGPVMPCRIASPKSPTPIHRAGDGSTDISEGSRSASRDDSGYGWKCKQTICQSGASTGFGDRNDRRLALFELSEQQLREVIQVALPDLEVVAAAGDDVVEVGDLLLVEHLVDVLADPE